MARRKTVMAGDQASVMLGQSGGQIAQAFTTIRFVEDFDYVTVGKTVAYMAGHIVYNPSAEIIAAAGDKAVSYADEQRVSEPEDGE